MGFRIGLDTCMCACVFGGGGVSGAGMGRVLGLFGSGFSDRRESNMTREQGAQKTH